MRTTAGHLTCLRLAVCLSILIATLLASNSPVLAAATTGRIAGVLKDPSGALVPGGRVTITNLQSGDTRFTTSDQEGRYVFDAVPAGRYQVSAISSGFAESVRNDVTVTAGGETTIGFELSVGRSTTSVSVIGAAITAAAETIAPARARTSAIRRPCSRAFPA